MQFKMIAGPQFFTSNGNTEVEYVVATWKGGRFVKHLGYMIKFLANSGADARYNLRIDHGPDGAIWTTYVSFNSGSPVAIPATNLAHLDTIGTSTMLMEWVRVVMIADSVAAGNGTSTFTAEIFEMRKAF